MSTDSRARSRFVLRCAGWLILAVLGFVLWSALAAGRGPGAWLALLATFLFFTSLAGGLVVWPAIIRSANGAWHEGLEGMAGGGLGFALPSLLLLVLLWIGSPAWSPWYLARHHQGGWLGNAFLFARDLVALLLFWGTAARYHFLLRRGRGALTGAILLALYALVFSLLGIDLVMALDPKWYSTLAGAYFFMTSLYFAVTAWAFLAAWSGGASGEQLHDLGKLVVAFSLIAAYLMYSHLLPIWYEALPHEVRFVIPRMNFEPWRTVSLALIALVYLGPLILLLPERVKRAPRYLGGVAFVLLCGMWVERWWLVVPTFEKDLAFGLPELSAIAAALGLFGVGWEVCRQVLPGGERRGERARHG